MSHRRVGLGLWVNQATLRVKFCAFIVARLRLRLRLMSGVGCPRTEWKQSGAKFGLPHLWATPLEDHGALNARVIATRPEDTSGSRSPRSPP